MLPPTLDPTPVREPDVVAARPATASAAQADAIVEGSSWGVLAVVVVAHAVALVGLAVGTSRPPPVSPPTVMGRLVSAPPSFVEPPRPLPVAPEPPRPRPVVRRAAPLPPVVRAASSDRAVAAAPTPTVPQVAPDAAPSPAALPAPSAPPIPVEAPSAVVPPRTDASRFDNPLPVYPTVSRRLGEEGQVLLDVYILSDGSVGEIKLKRSSGFERLDKAALVAIGRWRYLPARRGDTPIPYWYVQPFSWALDR